MGYRTTVIEVGAEAEVFLENDMAITFGENAPEALRPFCFLVERASLEGDLAIGQAVQIGVQRWAITAIGDVAQQNLANLGHVTLVFDGADEPRMPGSIHLSGPNETPALELGAAVAFGD